MPYDSLIARADVAGLIPDNYSREVIQSLAAQSVALGPNGFRQVTMPRGVDHVPVLTVLPSAYWVGETDTGRKQTSEANWENVTLYARELAVIIPIPEAVLDDSTVDLWGEIKPRLAEAFGAKIDSAALFGTDAPAAWPDSIVEQAVAAGNVVTEGTGIDLAEDVNLTWAEVEDDGFDVNVQWARRRIRSRLRGLRDANNQPIFADAFRGELPTLYGEPIIYVANGSWDDDYSLVVGDRSAAIIGIRRDISYRIFTEGVISDDNGVVVLNLMQQDAVAMRATMRVGYAVANPATRLNPTEGTRFPFAVLEAAGS